MSSITQSLVFDTVAGNSDLTGTNITTAFAEAVDSSATSLDVQGNIELRNGYRFRTGRITNPTQNKFPTELAFTMGEGTQLVITDSGIGQVNVLGQFIMDGQLIYTGTGTNRYIFGNASAPSGSIIDNGAGSDQWQWEMINNEVFEIIAEGDNITLHLARLNPFTSSLQFSSIGNSTLESPCVNAVYRRAPSATATSTAQVAPAGWGYADRFIHQLSPEGNGDPTAAEAIYASAWGLRTEYNFASTIDPNTKPSGLRQMLQINNNIGLWLVRPLKEDTNGALTPLLHTDLIPIGYHNGQFPNDDRGPDEIRVIIPHRPHFTDENGVAITELGKVAYLAFTGETDFEIRNAPTTFSPIIPPLVIPGGGTEVQVAGTTSDGFYVVDAKNAFANITNQTPLEAGNQVPGMNANRQARFRHYRWDTLYTHDIIFGGEMTDLTTITPEVHTAVDLTDYLNGKVDNTDVPELRAPGVTDPLIDVADIIPTIRRFFKDGSAKGAFPVVFDAEFIGYDGNVTLSSDATTTTGYLEDQLDVTARVALGSTLTYTPDTVIRMAINRTFDFGGFNIPAELRVDGQGSFSNFSTTITGLETEFKSDPADRPTLNFTSGQTYDIVDTLLAGFNLTSTDPNVEVTLRVDEGSNIPTPLPAGFVVVTQIDFTALPAIAGNKISVFDFTGGTLVSNVALGTVTAPSIISDLDAGFENIGSTVTRILIVTTTNLNVPEIYDVEILLGNLITYNYIGSADQGYLQSPGLPDATSPVNRVAFNLNVSLTQEVFTSGQSIQAEQAFVTNSPQFGLRVAITNFSSPSPTIWSYRMARDVVNTFEFARALATGHVSGQTYALNPFSFAFSGSGNIEVPVSFRIGADPFSVITRNNVFMTARSGEDVNINLIVYEAAGSFTPEITDTGSVDYERIDVNTVNAIDSSATATRVEAMRDNRLLGLKPQTPE